MPILLKPVIAIDGLTAAGKGTLSKRLAVELGFAHLDTGLLYRATALKTLDEDLSPIEAANRLKASDLVDQSKLRNERVAQCASQVAAVPEVREALIKFQRDFAREPNGEGAILDGRDIGTVICPQAEAKLFVTAEPEVRAERRFQELLAKGQDVIQSQVLDDLKQRDARDQSRDAAPTRPADGALVLDTSHMTPDQAFEEALTFIRKKLS